MHKIAFAGLAATLLASAAAAAGPAKHMLEVALPDGGTAHIEYYGDVAPRVTIAPARDVTFGGLFAPGAFPDFDALFQQMDRAHEAMMRQVRDIQSTQLAPGGALNVASYGAMPARSNSVTVTSVTGNGVTCTRTTEVTSQGAGKAPKVASSLSGTCGPDRGGAKPEANPTT